MANQNSSFTVRIPDSAAALSRAVGVRAAEAENGGGGPIRAVGVRAAEAENGGGGPIRARGAAADHGGGELTRMEAEELTCIPRVFTTYSILKYMVPSALALAALRYQGNTTNLFAENPIPAWCLLMATWVFFLIVGALKANFPRRNAILLRILIRAGLVSGLISIISSISIFIPRRYSFLPLVPVVPVAAVLAWPLLRSLYGWIADLVNNTFDKIRARVANCWGTEGSSLPV